jgi:geranylgeranyl diphosphate synthase, type II
LSPSADSTTRPPASAFGSFAHVEAALDRYRAITTAAVARYLPDKEPRRHLYDLVADYPTRPGKALRPALCLATCGAFGTDIGKAERMAATLELIHNGFLVHDDVEDESDHRRGRPTMHRLHGTPLAVNVGDALHVLSLRPLMECRDTLGPGLAWRLFCEIEHMIRESVEGQAMEIGWVHDNECDLTPDDYLRMTLKKTCWYTCIHPCRIGALIATGGHIAPESFDRFGYFLGAAFQIQDDMLNLVGDVDRYGKEILGDIWEGKRTLMLIHLLRECTADERTWVVGFLSRPRRSRRERDVRRVRRMMDDHASIEFGRSSARYLAGAALAEFELAYRDAEDNADTSFLRDLVLYMIGRDL